MKTSIKSKLFLITYGIILAFVLGLIILNNTFLEKYYIRTRERSLLEAFSDVSKVEVYDEDLSQIVYEIEKDYNVDIQILKELLSTENPFEEGVITRLPPPYVRLYGNQFSINDGIISDIMLEFKNQVDGFTSDQVKPIDVDDDNLAYLMEINVKENDRDNEFQLLSLCVAIPQNNQLNHYYILTVTVQSIRDSVAVFNGFTIVIGFIFMIISGALMYFISYRFTNPLLQINQVAKAIANMNFENKVDVQSNDEFGDLGRNINLMSTQLEASIRELQLANAKLANDIELKNKIDAMRKEFIANASHELKTPISLILGYCEALKLPDLDKATSEEYLNIIMDESNKMNRLVMQLLKISQLESGFTEPQISQFPIKDLIDETIRFFSILFEEKQVILQINSGDEEVESDFDQLQTVLTNFIANALHHLDESRLIRIDCLEETDGWLKIIVFNSGKNIPESEMERIWESFYKVDKARTRSYGGQGLGLSIAKTTLLNLGHRYGVKNEPGGVAFYFEIKKKNQTIND
ncbi:MAG: HAMP domain-containing sensor histidine kinase [Candidatus Izemoplasmatales bacterium]|nr:HAMP domain-containing sensor histidine kinase [Candidatus Izemoplasmatales bacterium]MDD4987761.1 HAMP domain-containing sensor histidine kinase [Candidatus Izemoplasmatales bacterium]